MSLRQSVDRAVREPIFVVPYTPDWPRLFEREAEFLRNRLPSSIVVRIEHFGSTAVGNLAAKPIIDILIEVASLEETRQQIVPILESQGYEYFWRTDVSVPYAWFIKRDTKGERTHHLHFAEADSELWSGLNFRDYLRQNPEIAETYAGLKTRLAREFPNDRIAYTVGKAEFISKITDLARRHFSAINNE